MNISGIAKSSFVDYPGLVACVLFVSGCNYNCFYCHNRALIDGPQEVIDLNSINAFLKKRVGQLDGVVISGGEPTLQKDLVSYAEGIKKLGFKLKLDTNGSSPHLIKQLLQTSLFDYYAVDYKAPAKRYPEICGASVRADAVLNTIGLLSRTGVPFEVRTTVIPQLAKSDLMQMAQELPVVPRYVLNPYRKPEQYSPCDQERIDQHPYTKSQIEALAGLIRPLQPHVMT